MEYSPTDNGSKNEQYSSGFYSGMMERFPTHATSYALHKDNKSMTHLDYHAWKSRADWLHVCTKSINLDNRLQHYGKDISSGV